MRRNIVLCLAAVGFLAVSVQNVSASHKGGHTCPFMVYEHAKELGLSKKQKSQVKDIKENFKNEMQALKKKYGEQTQAVLTAEQKEKYKNMKDSDCCAGEGKYGHKHKGEMKEGDSCHMKK